MVVFKTIEQIHIGDVIYYKTLPPRTFKVLQIIPMDEQGPRRWLVLDQQNITYFIKLDEFVPGSTFKVELPEEM